MCPTRADACELSIKRETMRLASRHIHENVKVGDVLKVSGPSVKFIFTGDNASGVVWIAGGVGITPVMSILRYLTDRARTGNIHFLIIAKTEQSLIFRDELRWLQSRYPDLYVCVTFTRPDSNTMWTGDRGRATAELFSRFNPSPTQLPVYLCGPNEMMDATTELLITLGVPSTKIHTEAFAGKKSSVSNSAGETASASDSSPTISRATPQTITMHLQRAALQPSAFRVPAAQLRLTPIPRIRKPPNPSRSKSRMNAAPASAVNPKRDSSKASCRWTVKTPFARQRKPMALFLPARLVRSHTSKLTCDLL